MADDLTIPQGVTWSVRWPVTDDEGEPVDVTTYGVRAQARATAATVPALHRWSTDLGNAVAGDGFVDLLVTPEDSLAWKWTTGVYDVKLDAPDETVTNVARGSITVEQSVTR